MADSPRPSQLWRPAALAAAICALAGCGGQSGSNQAAAVAQGYERALLTGNGRAACSLMGARVRREFGASATSCAQAVALVAPAPRDASSGYPIVTAVRVDGAQATATLRSTAGVSTLPLSREGGHWRVTGRLHYVSRNWLQADYRLQNAGTLSASAVASILDERVSRLIDSRVTAWAIGPDEVRVQVAEPVRLSDLARVTRREEKRLAFYDWEADALTPAGTPVAEGLHNRDGSAMLISQGSGSKLPGTTGGLPLRAAVKLAAAQRPIAGVGRSQRQVRGVPRGWTVLAGEDPSTQYFVLRDREALSSSDIRDSYLTVDGSGRPAIGIRFTSHGARALQRLTAEVARRGAMLSTPQLAVNQHFAVALDGKLLSVVFVNYHIYRLGIPADEATDIGGGFSPATADLLAREIGAPPLPADLQLIRTTTFSRRLPPGADLPAGGTKGPRQPAGPA
jgi:SecD-like export protein